MVLEYRGINLIVPVPGSKKKGEMREAAASLLSRRIPRVVNPITDPVGPIHIVHVAELRFDGRFTVLLNISVRIKTLRSHVPLIAER